MSSPTSSWTTVISSCSERSWSQPLSAALLPAARAGRLGRLQAGDVAHGRRFRPLLAGGPPRPGSLIARYLMTKQHQNFRSSPTALTIGSSTGGAGGGTRSARSWDAVFSELCSCRERSSSAGDAHYSDQMAERFFFDLRENVGQLITLTTGEDFGFMDTRIQAGMQWADVLLHAAGTCQVLIALLSAPYLKSKWCGMEWCAFSRRSAVRPPGAMESSAASRMGYSGAVGAASFSAAASGQQDDDLLAR